MALEDRVWYREEPSKAWKTRWDPDPAFRDSGSSRVRPGAFGAIVVSAAAVAAGWHWHLVPMHIGKASSAPGQAPAQPSPRSVRAQTPQANNLVRIRPTVRLTTPATTVSRWTLTDPRFGTISVYVPIGETPLRALTIALAQKGYQVIQ